MLKNQNSRITGQGRKIKTWQEIKETFTVIYLVAAIAICQETTFNTTVVDEYIKYIIVTFDPSLDLQV